MPDTTRQRDEAREPVRVIVLGSTGSIGTQTLETIAHLNQLHGCGKHPRSYRIVGLAAGANADLVASQASQFGVGAVAVASGAGPSGMLRGPDAAERLIRETPCDLVVAAIVGSAGLAPTLAAIEAGRDIALANKETLVAAGELAVSAARRSGSRLLPVDSEHSGAWQAIGLERCPPFDAPASVRRLVLTASGGPFREKPIESLRTMPVAEALRHPTWRMGPKVTIDSASLMNKALEIIEASWLFGLPADRLGAVVHPQSVVHAWVEHDDGSVVAQMGAADMRVPIQVALSWPDRSTGVGRKLDLLSMGSLTFEPVDPRRYPAFGLAQETLRLGGTAGAILNAANEEAVGAYLAGNCCFGEIPEFVSRAMAEVGVSPLGSLDDVRRAETEARKSVRHSLNRSPAASRLESR
ncbi:MAG: 1-deoxy-D-xylulose-5-phosphate reductoisomerase [Tepidisphaera sp.]